MAIIEKSKLKEAFSEGAIPSQEDFENLIDSLLHREDSGFISAIDGLRLSPIGKDKKFITFFEKISDLEARWNITAQSNGENGVALNINSRKNGTLLFLQEEGRIGIKNEHPVSELDVNGLVAMKGRLGTFACGEVLADGNWYKITPKLDECSAFEIVAKVGKKGMGLYSMIHAIALSTFGKSSNTIDAKCAYYGSFLNKLELKWEGDTFNYHLFIRTRKNYGENINIKYHVAKLWDDSFFDEKF